MGQINILVIDTSAVDLRVGLCINNKKSFIDLNTGYKHVEKLLPSIQLASEKIKEDKSKIKYIGVCTGPGSFTGIRIGIASALGLSYSTKIKCFGFSIFDVYKFLLGNSRDSIILPVVDAKKNKFYCSFIEHGKKIKMHDMEPGEIIDEIKKRKNKKIIFAGRDSKIIKDNVSGIIPLEEVYTEGYTSRDLLEFAEYHIKSGKSLKKPVPIYLRKSEAEIMLLKKKNKPAQLLSRRLHGLSSDSH